MLSKFGLRKRFFRILGSDFGGFPNFSSYLGARRHSLTNDEIAFVAPRLQDAKIIFDIGANFGVFAIYFAKLAPQATVFAFEPHPGTASALRENVRRSAMRNITVVESALSASDGHVLFQDGSDPATNRITETIEGGLRVKSRSLTSFCAEYSVDRIDFLKMDIEGAEMFALLGAGELFAHQRVLCGMIEVCPSNLCNYGQSALALNDFFADNGYQLFVLGSNQSHPIDDSLASENAGFVIRKAVSA